MKARRCHESSDELLVVICKVLDDKTLCVESRSDLAKLWLYVKFVFGESCSGEKPKKLFRLPTSFLGPSRYSRDMIWALAYGLAF